MAGKQYITPKKIISLFIAIIALFISLYTALVKQEDTPVKESITGCQNVPDLSDNSERLVTKVIDGDTFLIEGGYSVRVLGFDADERGYPCYNVATKRMEELVLDKEVRLEKGPDDKDQWCRYLRYALIGEDNVGIVIVREGLAVSRASSEGGLYQEEFSESEKDARAENIGCKWNDLVTGESTE
ncbi:MAG: thermonuclease family protein [bacterium]